MPVRSSPKVSSIVTLTRVADARGMAEKAVDVESENKTREKTSSGRSMTEGGARDGGRRAGSYYGERRGRGAGQSNAWRARSSWRREKKERREKESIRTGRAGVGSAKARVGSHWLPLARVATGAISFGRSTRQPITPPLIFRRPYSLPASGTSSRDRALSPVPPSATFC